jgi:hypothetical protein
LDIDKSYLANFAMKHQATSAFSLPLSLVLLLTTTCWGRVTAIEIVERKPFAGGQSFGDVGSYEVIRGRLHYAVDSGHPANRSVVDLHLAEYGQLRHDDSRIEQGRIVEVIGNDARDDRGHVTFVGDFLLLKPVDLSRGNHRLLYDVNNRGLPVALSFFNDAPLATRPETVEHAGNGWLMRQGYSVLWSGWNWDVEGVGRQPLRVFLPIVVAPDGNPLTQSVNAELEVQDSPGNQVVPLAWGASRCYPVADGTERTAVLTVRDRPDRDSPSDRQIIDRDQWRFARVEAGEIVDSPVHVFLEDGFVPGKIYELTYTAKNSRVVGLGLTAIRDAISFFHFDLTDERGMPNPLAVDGRPDSEFAYIFGVSQSGRVITHMLYQGFHVDEEGRLIFEGARPHVAGGGKGGFNYRFAQTTHHPKHLQGNYFPADHFPFNYTPAGLVQFDPLGQPGRKTGDVLADAKRLGKIPKIMVVNHEGEYWTRSASLIHTDVSGQNDVACHSSVRMYLINGARHGPPVPESRRTSRTAAHSINHLDQRPVNRALLVALDQWVTDGIEPPDDRVPRIDRGELLHPSEHQRRFPKIPPYSLNGVDFPGVRHPGVNLKPPRVDYGSRWWTEGIQDHVPPRYFGPPYETLVPAFDEDGNPVGGIRMPDLTVPLGTYQAFNPRANQIGAADYLKAFDSSFWPFANNEHEKHPHDPRRPLSARYPDHQTYVARVEAEVAKLINDRLLLTEDAKSIVDFARSLRWPPTPIDRHPFWEMGN